MARYREQLPQLGGELLITDGGIETTLIFHDGLDLPHFAAFHLLQSDEGTVALRRYFDAYAAIAREHCVGLLLESPTWRANPDWARAIGYRPDELDQANRKALALLEEVRDPHETHAAPVVISGCVGPRHASRHLVHARD